MKSRLTRINSVVLLFCLMLASLFSAREARSAPAAKDSPSCSNWKYGRAEVHYNRAESQAKAGKYADAASSYEKADEICPSPTLVMLQAVARDALAKNEMEKARQILLEGLAKYASRTDRMSLEARKRGQELLREIEKKLAVNKPAPASQEEEADPNKEELGAKDAREVHQTAVPAPPAAASAGKIAFIAATGLTALTGTVAFVFAGVDWFNVNRAAQEYNRTFSPAYKLEYHDAFGRFQLAAGVGGALIGAAGLTCGIYLVTRTPEAPRVGLQLLPISGGALGTAAFHF